MRIVTWNMDSWKHGKRRDEAWDFLLDEVQPDIALLQEAMVPEEARRPEGAKLPRNTSYDVLWASALKRGTSLEALT